MSPELEGDSHVKFDKTFTKVFPYIKKNLKIKIKMSWLARLGESLLSHVLLLNPQRLHNMGCLLADI